MERGGRVGRLVVAGPEGLICGRERTAVLGVWKVSFSFNPSAPFVKAINRFLWAETQNSQGLTKSWFQVFLPLPGFTPDASTEQPLAVALLTHGHWQRATPALKATLEKLPGLFPHFLSTKWLSF